MIRIQVVQYCSLEIRPRSRSKTALQKCYIRGWFLAATVETPAQFDRNPISPRNFGSLMSTQIAVPEAEEIGLSAAPVVPSVVTLPREERVAAMPKLGRKHQHGMNWFTTVFMIIFHAGAIAALFFFTWKALICALVLWVLATNVGIGMSYHRLLTHRGYHVPKWLEYALAICGTLALEGGPVFWVSVHRLHHQMSDHEGDPHTPQEGGWWAHAGWILIGDSLSGETESLARYVPISCATASWYGSAPTTGSPRSSPL